jgi:thiol-disulfide isomerase/thioredoxin
MQITACNHEKTGQTATTEKPQETEVVEEDAPSGTNTYKNLVDNGQFSFEAVKDHVILVDFWATWCPPCRAEIPGFIELYDKYKDQKVTIVGVSVDRGGESVVKKFIESNKINYPIIMVTPELQSQYESAIGKRITAIPTTVILKRDGTVASVHVGARPKEVFDKEIQELL